MREISISWDPDPIGTIHIPDGTLTMMLGQDWDAICRDGSFPRHQPQPFRASDLSPFLVVSAVKISITSSLSLYRLASFPASPFNFDHAPPFCTNAQSYTNLHHPLPPPSFPCLTSTNESFSWTMTDLYLFSRLKMQGSVSVLSVPGAHARDRSAPAPGSKRNGNGFFSIHLHPACFSLNIHAARKYYFTLPEALSQLDFFFFSKTITLNLQLCTSSNVCRTCTHTHN